MGRWSWDRICLLTKVHSWKFTESNYKILLRNWNCDFWSFLTTCGWGFRILRYDTASSDNWISPFRKNITSCFSQASNFRITPGLNYPWRWRQYLCCKHRFPITWWLICTWKRNPQFSVCLFQLFLRVTNIQRLDYLQYLVDILQGIQTRDEKYRAIQKKSQ
jgi:hypothetical protein